MDTSKLRTQAYQWILDLATDEGINASGKNEVYGCIFGRDSAITILKILKVYSSSPDERLLEISKRGITSLLNLQGREFNNESGEEPGKFIHEFRRDKYERLINRPRPWYVYPDGVLRNYDSIDSTSLSLIAIYNYWKITKDNEFLLKALPSVEAGLNWQITFGDKDKDNLLEYELPHTRKHGGLVVQSWTDSHNSIENIKGEFPLYPIAPVEVQGYAWLAFKLWADFYETYSPTFSHKLSNQAKLLKEQFNKTFLIKDNDYFYAAQALDGVKKQIATVTANPLLLLWASYKKNGKTECIVDDSYISHFVKRAFQEDMFDADAGIRTMSMMSPTYNATSDSYHNGSFWPMLNGLIHEGLENWNYQTEANALKDASLKPLFHFKTPIELYIRTEDGAYGEYQNPRGQMGCRYQAWSAASFLDWLTP